MLTISEIIGAAVLGIGAVMTLEVTLPDPPLIEPHLIYFDGIDVYQDRTIHTDDAVAFLIWSASARDAVTLKQVENCTGSGNNHYKPGRLVFHEPMDRWTGNPLCNVSALPQLFYFEACWLWGTDQICHRSVTYDKNDVWPPDRPPLIPPA